MNWLDITLICLTGLGLVKGLFDGVVKQVVSLIALLVAIFFSGRVAVQLHGPLASLGWFSDTVLVAVCYILSFLLILGGLILVGNLFHKVIGATPLGIINHLAGGILGMVIMLFICSALINLYEMADGSSRLISESTKKESRFYYWTQSLVPAIYPYFSFPGWGEKMPSPGKSLSV